ncbi:amino acid ABC transporter ATP-binding protein [Nocardia sp. CA-107356]|uniref:amino acid ABC transporter ATP-binding protein n=1 Tax=Nocardia sp. CA-107356 TaxID=3239972 RepID=UPI003D93F164
MTTTPLIELRGVHKCYGSQQVLRGIDLAIHPHEVVCLIGASGSGKSTLLRCVNALEDIQQGQVMVDGDVVSGPGVDVNALRRSVGMVFQSYNLFPHMTVLQNIALAPRTVLGERRSDALARSHDLLDQVGLAHKGHCRPDQLSGGQQQRVAIARALAMCPKALLLDEVTSALDPELVGEVLDLLRALAEDGMTMLLATHEMSFARDVATKVCFLHQGVVLEQGTPEKIFEHPDHERTRAFLRRVLPTGAQPSDTDQQVSARPAPFGSEVHA